jgi:hypothetical protein
MWAMANRGNAPGGTKMTRIRRLTVAALILLGGLVIVNPAGAGPILDWLGCGNCPPPDYSPSRYWLPRLARVNDCVHGPTIPMHATDQHPEIAPNNYLLEYRCPPVLPENTLIPTPTPPATSRFRY